VIDEVGGKLFGVILNNVNIKTDDNYYYYAGYSTQYGYKRRQPRAKKKEESSSPQIALDDASPPIEPTNNPDESSVGPSDNLPRVTYINSPQDEDRY
jgi:hypothetical protein